MRATVFVDVLSHWCLAAMPAMRTLGNLTPNIEIVYAPTHNGKPGGYSRELMQWYLKRGSLAYGREFRADWYEGPQGGTWFANAVALVGTEMSGEAMRTMHAMMSAALEQGAKAGRADVCFELMGKYLGIPASDVAARVNDPATAARLEAGNHRLAALGADERPTFLLESEIGDRALLKGMWQEDAVAGVAMALLHDERSYAAAGPQPA